MKTMEKGAGIKEHEQRKPVADSDSTSANVSRLQSRLESKRLAKARAQAKSAIVILMTLFLVKGIFYVFATPPWQAPDEPFHFSYEMQVAGEPQTDKSHESQIIESMARWDFWPHQMQMTPDPLPYGFADIPFFSTIAALERGPFYYRVLSPMMWMTEGLPIEKRLYLLRIINLLLASGVVALTYFMAKSVWPEDRFMTLAPPMFVALLPQFSFISTSFTSDNLINLLFAAFTILSVLMCLRGFNWTRLAFLLLVMLVAVFVKRSAIIMIFVTTFLPFFVFIRGQDKAKKFLAVLLVEASVVALASVITVSFQQVRGFLRETLKVHLEISNLINKLDEFTRQGVMTERLSFNIKTVLESFWGHFGWMNIPLDSWCYYILPWPMIAVTALGCVYGFWSMRGNFGQNRRLKSILALLFMLIVSSFIFGLARTSIYEFVPFQGRYMFVALPAIAMMSAWGVRCLLPNVDGRKLLVGFGLAMFMFELIALVGFMLPGYYYV